MGSFWWWCWLIVDFEGGLDEVERVEVEVGRCLWGVALGLLFSSALQSIPLPLPLLHSHLHSHLQLTFVYRSR